MKTINCFLICFFIFNIESAFSQISYPFKECNKENDILAYWYNVPDDSVTLNMMGKTFKFYSLFQIYGVAKSDSFEIKAEVYFKDGKKPVEYNFNINRNNPEKTYDIQFNNNVFKLEKPVSYQKYNPDKIIITIKSPQKEISKEIKCIYHKLYGNITDFSGQPFRGFVTIRPDDFNFSTSIWSDSLGNYEIFLPERTYNNIAVDDESYGIKTVEAWAWHIILDCDQKLDFKVGTGEIYNLNVWTNNGGGNTYFISFRPMSLHLFKNMSNKIPITIGDNIHNLVDVGPELTINDISVKVGGQEVKIISLQKYYETANGDALLAYLLQVNRDNLSRVGKQTILVEYDNEFEINGKKLKNKSMGYFQIYLNYSGLTTYF